MKESQSAPQFERVSIVAAMILLAYSLLPYIQTPSREISFLLFGILIEFNANLTLLIAFLAAGLAISGTDWLLSNHPARAGHPLYPHYLLPALTAAVIGVPLALLKVNIQWWVVFGLGTLLLLAVLMAEYVSIDSRDTRHAIAQMVLNGVSFGLLLTLSISIRASGLRLYLLLFTLTPLCMLLCLRLFHLRLQGHWNWEWAAAITLIITQSAIGLYYLPLSPARFGLALLGITYGLVELAAMTQPVQWSIQKLFSPLVITGLFWVMAILIG